MGADPEAILYYGIDLKKAAEEHFWSADYDYHRMNDEWDSVHSPPRPEHIDRRDAPEWEAWRVELMAYESSPVYVRMTWFGAEGCERYVVHCPGLERRVEWDEQIDLGFPTLEKQPDADERIRQFCERFKVPFKQPTWHLAAHYF